MRARLAAATVRITELQIRMPTRLSLDADVHRL
jgi:hypothetical protein